MYDIRSGAYKVTHVTDRVLQWVDPAFGTKLQITASDTGTAEGTWSMTDPSPANFAITTVGIRDVDGKFTDFALGALQFLNVPFCSEDSIRLTAVTSNSAFQPVWVVEGEVGSGCVVVPTSPTNGQLSLDVRVDVSGFPFFNRTEPRPAMGFSVTVRLMEGLVERAVHSINITQDTLGRLRQEYVDHDIEPQDGQPKIPGISSFRQLSTSHPYNGDNYFDWAIVDAWAEAAIKETGQIAGQAGIPTPHITSVYRSPSRHWLVYKNKGMLYEVKGGSRHLWGQAVDFRTKNLGVGTLSENYTTLANLCRHLGDTVIWEGVYDHVHIQKFGNGSNSAISVQPLRPDSFARTDAGFVVKIVGTGFVPAFGSQIGSYVLFDGAPVPTSFVSTTELSAVLLAPDAGRRAPSELVVVNFGIYGAQSNRIPVVFPHGRPPAQ